jgi:coenzyme F420-0:L-glutamate ligase/coenzyme F420-1:gamma-L-glutamate ligase
VTAPLTADGPPALRVDVVPDVGEVAEGADLAALLDGTRLDDGDVVVVTSKIVSKAEGRVTDRPKEEALAEETVRVVARRGPTTIARTRHGLVMAAAGIDASNVTAGRLVLLPRDPDASARRLRRTLAERRGVDVGVVVTDTAGRAWRVGQTDIAIGAAGLAVVDDHAGRVDAYGNLLAVTLPAVADEIAGAAELATGKLSMSPVSVVRGLSHLVLARGEDGPGAVALVRPEREDMFGLGAREAVLAALASVTSVPTAADAGPAGTAGHPGLGAPVAAGDLVRVLDAALAPALDPAPARATTDGPQRVVVVLDGLDERARGRAEVVVAAVAAAHGWRVAALEAARTELAPAGSLD